MPALLAAAARREPLRPEQHGPRILRTSMAPDPVGYPAGVSRLPDPRGEITEHLVAALSLPVHPVLAPVVEPPVDPLGDEDLQLALYLCYELHYRGLPGVAEDWEWEPSLLALRRDLELRFEDALRAAVPVPPAPPSPDDMDLAL